MDSNTRQQSEDWRTQLSMESRRRVLSRILDTLKKFIHFSGPQGVQDLHKIAVRFEEMSFNAASDQKDYLNRISSKMSSVQARSNAAAGVSTTTLTQTNPQDPAIQNVQPQVQNQGPSLPVPMTSIQNPAAQGVDINQTKSERQTIQHVSHQQLVHRSQNPQEYIYPQQLQQPLLKQDLCKGVTKEPLTQPLMQSSLLSVVQNMPAMQPSIAPVRQQSQPSFTQRQEQQSQQLLGQKNNIVTMHQQQLASRSHVGNLPQKQQLLLESQSGDGQQQSQKQEMMLHMPSHQMAQVQQQIVSQKQPNSVESNMQQKIKTSELLLLQQNNQQKTFPSQRNPAEAPSALLDCTTQNGISRDWQEEVYQKIKALKEMYFAELFEAHQRILSKMQQLGSLSLHHKSGEKLRNFKRILETLLQYLQVTKNHIQQNHLANLGSVEKHILKVLEGLGPRKAVSPMLQRQLPSTHLIQKTEQPEEHILRNESQLQAPNVLHSSVQGSSAIISSQQKMMSPLQPVSNMVLVQSSTPTSIKQNRISTSQLASTRDSIPQIGMNSVNSNRSSLRPASSMVQSQLMKETHKQQIMQGQQLKEPFQQHNIHQQLQQTSQKQKQHMQHGQLQQMDIKPQTCAQNLSEGKKYTHQQLKPGLSFPNISLQSTQASSPPVKDQSSLSVVPSPTPSAPSPIHGDPEKDNALTSSVSNATSIIHQHTCLASPFLEELSPQDSHGDALNSSGKSSVTEPLERLLKVVKSMSSKTLNASVSDISSVVSMIDRMGGPTPGVGSRAIADEDLAGVTNYYLQARNWTTQDGSIGIKRKRECTNFFTLNAALFVGSPTDSFEQSNGSDLDFAVSSCVKRPRIEINPALLEEIRKINESLIDTVVDMCDKDFAGESGEGIVVQCCYNAVTLSPNLKLYYASEKMLPIRPIRLLVPVNYPNCSPILLDKFPATFSKEYNDLSCKAYSRFSAALRTVSQPMCLMEIVRTWDDCARSAICEYASLLGGGTFSSKFGTLDTCLSVA